MAASVRIEDEAFSDARYDHLAKLLGVSKFDALGRMAFIWRQCTQEQTHSLEASLVAVFVDPNLLIECRLAEENNGLIRIKGTEGRIEWLGRLRKNARKGGRANRANWLSKREPGESPPAPAPTNIREEAGTAAPPGDPAQLELVKAKVNDAVGEVGVRRAGSETHQPAVDAFHGYFKSVTGSKPTWGDKQIAMVKTLVAKHSCAEVVRRISVLQTAPPKFPPQPWDLPTFVQHFDKCAGQAAASTFRRSTQL